MNYRFLFSNNMRAYGVYILFIVLVPTLCEVPKGVIVNSKDGNAYKVMYQSQTWTAARDTCAQMGAKLAVPKTKEQFAFIQKIVRSMHYPSIVGTRYKLLAWLGISNLDNYRTWKNVDGENIEDTGFSTWAGKYNGLISDDPKEPHCVGMDAMNVGLRDWWCHLRQPYICEMSS